jgi:large subunit ribosomal protein L10
MFKGMTGVVVSGDDPVAAARIVKDSLGAESKIEVKGGILEGSVLDAVAALGVADMASKEDLLATLLRTMQEGPRQLVGVLAAPGRDLVYLLKNFETKLAESPGNE